MIRNRALCILTLAIICMLSAANASGNIQQVQAYENKDLKIVYNNQSLTFVNSGTVLSPLMYQGMTYVPLLPFSDMIKLEARWEQETSTMYLGPSEEGTDFIDKFEPYVASGIRRNYSDLGEKKKIASKTYSHWIDLTGESYAFYDLEGKYKTLTLKAYSTSDYILTFIGDNKTTLSKFEIIRGNLPQTLTVNVTNVIQFEIHTSDDVLYNGHSVYLVDAIIK